MEWIGSVGKAEKLIQCNPLCRAPRHTTPHKWRRWRAEAGDQMEVRQGDTGRTPSIKKRAPKSNPIEECCEE